MFDDDIPCAGACLATATCGCSGLPSRIAVGHEPTDIRRHSAVSHTAPQGALLCCLCGRLRPLTSASAGRCRWSPGAGDLCQHLKATSPLLLTRAQVSGVLVSVLVMSRSFGTRINALEVCDCSCVSLVYSLPLLIHQSRCWRCLTRGILQIIVRDFARSSSYQHRLTYASAQHSPLCFDRTSSSFNVTCR